MSTKCKAKDPSDCRFHSKRYYTYAIEDIELATKLKANAKSFKDMEALQDKIDKAVIRKDSNEYGYKKLLKEFNKAVRNNNLDQQLNLATRIKLSTEERLKDGDQSEWMKNEAYSNPTKLASMVIIKAETQDNVPIPIQLTGTGNMLTLCARFYNEGWEVKGLFQGNEKENGTCKIRTDNTNNIHLQKTFDYLKANKEDLKNNDIGKIYEDYFSPRSNTNDNAHTFNGMIATKNGRDVKVYGSWIETDKDR